MANRRTCRHQKPASLPVRDLYLSVIIDWLTLRKGRVNPHAYRDRGAAVEIRGNRSLPRSVGFALVAVFNHSQRSKLLYRLTNPSNAYISRGKPSRLKVEASP